MREMFLYFGMRQYDDIKEITLGDVKVLNEGNLEVYVGRSKTDQEGHGFVFHMSGERMRGFSIPDVLEWYADSLRLETRVKRVIFFCSSEPRKKESLTFNPCLSTYYSKTSGL